MKYNLFDIIAIIRSWFYNPEKNERYEILKLCMRALDSLRSNERLDRLIARNRNRDLEFLLLEFSGELEWKYRAAESFLRTYSNYVVRMDVAEEKINILQTGNVNRANTIKKIISFSPNIIEIKSTQEIQEWCDVNIPGKWKYIDDENIFIFNDTNAVALFKLYWD